MPECLMIFCLKCYIQRRKPRCISFTVILLEKARELFFFLPARLPFFSFLLCSDTEGNLYTDVHQTSSPSSARNPIGTSDINSNGNSFTQLESVDYNQLRIEQAHLQYQNQHPIQTYPNSGQLVSMSGVIENGQFVPIQLNTMSRSINNNSIIHSHPLHQQTNQNQLHIPSNITYQCSSPLYQQSTYMQAPPSLLPSNIPQPEAGGMKRVYHDVSVSIDNDTSVQDEDWRTAGGTKKINRSVYNSDNINAANQPTTAPANFCSQTYHNRTPYAQPQNNMSNGSNQVTMQAQRYAVTRYPFSPFVIHFKDDVRDKLAVEHLVNHSKEQLDFVLQIIGYRKSQVNCRNNRLIRISIRRCTLAVSTGWQGLYSEETVNSTSTLSSHSKCRFGY
jgi:hypothetical protein